MIRRILHAYAIFQDQLLVRRNQNVITMRSFCKFSAHRVPCFYIVFWAAPESFDEVLMAYQNYFMLISFDAGVSLRKFFFHFQSIEIQILLRGKIAINYLHTKLQ